MKVRYNIKWKIVRRGEIFMKLYIGCDHGGLDLKNVLITYLKEQGHEITDVGTYTYDSCDYPVYAKQVAEAVRDKKCDRGIVICSTGIGVLIVANKVKGVRCALVTDVTTARLTREHNDTNCLALGQKNVSYDRAKEIADIWLATPFSNGERHKRRISMIEEE